MIFQRTLVLLVISQPASECFECVNQKPFSLDLRGGELFQQTWAMTSEKSSHGKDLWHPNHSNILVRRWEVKWIDHLLFVIVDSCEWRSTVPFMFYLLFESYLDAKSIFIISTHARIAQMRWIFVINWRFPRCSGPAIATYMSVEKNSCLLQWCVILRWL